VLRVRARGASFYQYSYQKIQDFISKNKLDREAADAMTEIRS